MFIAATKILAALLSLWLWVADNAQAKPITLAYNTNSLNVMLPILVAQELGFFTGEGFDVTAVYVRSGPTAMTALVSGSADYAIVGSTTVVQAIAKGIPAVVIGNYVRHVNWMLMGGAGVVNLSSIKEQVVGVTSAGGMTEFLTVEALARRASNAIATIGCTTRATARRGSRPWRQRLSRLRRFRRENEWCSNRKAFRC